MQLFPNAFACYKCGGVLAPTCASIGRLSSRYPYSSYHGDPKKTHVLLSVRSESHGKAFDKIKPLNLEISKRSEYDKLILPLTKFGHTNYPDMLPGTW